MDVNEKRLLGKVREVCLKKQDESILILKAVDKRKVRGKGKEIVNRILHNCYMLVHEWLQKSWEWLEER